MNRATLRLRPGPSDLCSSSTSSNSTRRQSGQTRTRGDRRAPHLPLRPARAARAPRPAATRPGRRRRGRRGGRDRDPGSRALQPAARSSGCAGFGVSLAVAFAPVGRRTPEEWVPIVLSFSLRWVRRRLRFRSPAPIAGTFAAERSRPFRRLLKPPHPHPPPTLKGIRILDVPYRGPRDRGPVRPSAPTTHGRSGLPRDRVLAARPRGAGAPAGPLGPGPLGSRRRSDSAHPMARADRARPRVTSSPAGCTTSAIRGSRCGARR